MAMLNDLKKYEISFLTAEESDRSAVVKIVNEHKGTINDEGRISKIKLAYPINKESSSYFGYFVFSVSQNDVKKIETDLRMNPKILRFLILTPPIMKSVDLQSRAKKPIVEEQKATKKIEKEKIEAKKSEAKTALSNEELEKKLEEILK